MKIKNIVNLIKYHSKKDDLSFNREVYDIANEFHDKGDEQMAEYLVSLISNSRGFVPQSHEIDTEYLKKIDINNEGLYLPDPIKEDILGITHAITRDVGVNKFLFEGKPGTGKTEAAKQLARILGRNIYMVIFSSIIDSKLGETQKNIDNLFNEINSLNNKTDNIILFDEIDALALDRTNKNDLREMGRATSTFLKQLDALDERVVLVATTNLYEDLDAALKRRFDFVINFDRYSREDIIEISINITSSFLKEFKINSRDKQIVRKIITLMDQVPSPGEMKNYIRAAIAFSDPKDEKDYLKKLYTSLLKKKMGDKKSLQDEGFTVREISTLTNASKSSVSREINQ